MSKYIEEDLHSEDLQEIIAKPPSWLLQRGISFILFTILMIFGISVFIEYPETINTTLKINATNAPKVMLSKINGNLVDIIAKEESWVKANQDIAYMESLADHQQVLTILERLKSLRGSSNVNLDLDKIASPGELKLGELQNSYQNFYLAYLNYQAVKDGGIVEKRKSMILNELNNVNEQNERIKKSYELQKQELELAEQEFNRYKALADKKVISPLELQQKEAALLAKKQAIPQMESNIISNRGNLLSKDKELSEINNQIFEEEKKFVQSLNSFISEAENWRKQYVITSPSEGYLIYGGFLQVNQFVKSGDPLFYVDTNKDDYYGEMLIPQSTSSKVKEKQEVIIKVRSFPYQEYGYLKGKIDYISAIPLRDSVFLTKVSLMRADQDSVIKLKPGIIADAEIITEDKSIFYRIWSNLTKSLKF
jgi:multidrug efflux pump subunit AcrA (membrane-fusion protein)